MFADCSSMSVNDSGATIRSEAPISRQRYIRLFSAAASAAAKFSEDLFAVESASAQFICGHNHLGGGLKS